MPLLLILMVEAKSLTSNIKVYGIEPGKNTQLVAHMKKLTKQMIKICTISLLNILMGI